MQADIALLVNNEITLKKIIRAYLIETIMKIIYIIILKKKLLELT